jgi:anthranilate phosphoribosyltransferase
VFAGRCKDAVVFRGADGLDELTLGTSSSVWWVSGGQVTQRAFDPLHVGLQRQPIESLRGADAAHNAQVARDLFGGERGAVRDAVVLNAGMALALAGPDLAATDGSAGATGRAGDRIEVPGPSLDIVGTGADRSNTVNISTMASIIIAASGIRVVKHGNRAASSASGSADVLEALGVNLTLTPQRVAEVASEAGITFCFAQAFHPAMRHAAVARSGLGVGTAFNVLGPLTNPAQPTYAVVGVADPRMAPLMAGVFAGRGKDAVVFRGDDGLDELTLGTTSSVWWVSGGRVTQRTFDPLHVGLQRQPIESLRGADAAHNAQVARDLFGGQRGAVRDAVVLNAGMALALAGPDLAATDGSAGATGRAGDRIEHDVSDEAFAAAVRVGMDRAEATLDSGAAAAQLDRWAAATQRTDPA